MRLKLHGAVGKPCKVEVMGLIQGLSSLLDEILKLGTVSIVLP